MKNSTSLRLLHFEKLLQVWRDHWFQIAMTHHQLTSMAFRQDQIPPLTGPALHWKGINDFLTAAPASLIKGEDIIWMGSPTFDLPTVALFPVELKVWTSRSKRIFHLGEKFLSQIQRIKLDEIQWEDLIFPYESFAIMLDKPIENGNDRYNMILCSNFSVGTKPEEIKENLLYVRLISEGSLQYEPIPRLLRKQAEDHVLKKRWAELSAIWPSIKSHYTRNAILVRTIGMPMNMDVLVGPIKPVHELPPEVFWGRLTKDMPALSSALRLIAHLCLFLEHSRKYFPGEKESVKSKKKKTGKRPRCGDLTAISQELDIFQIGCVSSLGLEVLNADSFSCRRQSGSRKDPDPHWRRKHKRRPPRSEPDAPKEIKVSGAPVNFHLLLEGTTLKGGKIVIPGH